MTIERMFVLVVLLVAVPSSATNFECFNEFVGLGMYSGYNITGKVKLVAEDSMTFGIVAATVTTTMGAMYVPANGTFNAFVHDSVCSTNSTAGSMWMRAGIPIQLPGMFVNSSSAFALQAFPMFSSPAIDAAAKSAVIYSDTNMPMACCNLVAISTDPSYQCPAGSNWVAFNQNYSVMGEASVRPFADQSQGKISVQITTTNGVTTGSVSSFLNTTDYVFPVHVHAKACSDSQAGGHWQLHPGGLANTSNEIWWSLPSSSEPNFKGWALKGADDKVPLIESRAMSFVIHLPSVNGTKGTAKAACCDAAPVPYTQTSFKCGVWANVSQGYSVSGMAKAIGEMGSTFGSINLMVGVNGTTPTGQFSAKLFGGTCAAPGAQWKMNSSVPAGNEPNELMYVSASVSGNSSVNVAMFPTFQSAAMPPTGGIFVVQAPTIAGTFACCNLMPTYPATTAAPTAAAVTTMAAAPAATVAATAAATAAASPTTAANNLPFSSANAQRWSPLVFAAVAVAMLFGL